MNTINKAYVVVNPVATHDARNYFYRGATARRVDCSPITSRTARRISVAEHEAPQCEFPIVLKQSHQAASAQPRHHLARDLDRGATRYSEGRGERQVARDANSIRPVYNDRVPQLTKPGDDDNLHGWLHRSGRVICPGRCDRWPRGRAPAATDATHVVGAKV